jgi:hypothetical protein
MVDMSITNETNEIDTMLEKVTEKRKDRENEARAELWAASFSIIMILAIMMEVFFFYFRTHGMEGLLLEIQPETVATEIAAAAATTTAATTTLDGNGKNNSEENMGLADRSLKAKFYFAGRITK